MLVTVLSTSLLTGAGLLSFQSLQRQTQRKELRDSIESRFADDDGDARKGRRRLLRRRRRASSPSSNSVKRPNGIHIQGDGFEDDASDDSNGNEDEDEDEELEDYTMTPTTARREMQRARSALADMEEEQRPSRSTMAGQPRTAGNSGSSNGKGAIDQEIIDEALARNLAFLGPEALAKVRGSFVIVVGLGGVGSAAGQSTRLLLPLLERLC